MGIVRLTKPIALVGAVGKLEIGAVKNRDTWAGGEASRHLEESLLGG